MLDITLALISHKNIDEVVQVLKKEIVRSQGQDFERGAEYRQILVQSIHQCAIK